LFSAPPASPFVDRPVSWWLKFNIGRLQTGCCRSDLAVERRLNPKAAARQPSRSMTAAQRLPVT